MKSVWLSCSVLCFGILAGCSSATSTADQSGDASVAITDPEWAKGDQPAPDVSVAMKIQPIPDMDDDDTSSAGEDAPPAVKPIPDDGN